MHVSFIVGTQRCDILTMRMAAIGKLGKFRTNVEDWSQYSVRMEFYFVANGVRGDAKKNTAFLSVIGPSNYKRLQSLIGEVTTVQDADVHVADLITALQNHFEPQPSAIVQRAKFYSRLRERGETVAQYLSELQAIAASLNFGDKQDDMLRDRLVSSINDSAMQQ